MLKRILKALETYTKYEKELLNLRCVYAGVHKEFNTYSKITSILLNKIYKRAVMGFKIGNIDYVYNRQSMRKLLNIMVRTGVIT